jgi:peptide/nickel transport system permease protein
MSFFGSFFYDVSATLMNYESVLLAPSNEHLFGTDRLGRDILARVIEGGKTSLIIGFASSTLASLIALFIGAGAGYLRSYYDKIFVIIVDLFLTFPTLFLLLALVSYINASSMILILIISLTGWMSSARMLRSESYSISSKPFIKILKIAKLKDTKIIFKYFTPLLAPIFLVSFTFGVSGAILAESSLSFLGLGIVAPQMSWGSILSSGKEVIDIAWWVSFFPGLMIFLVTFSLITISSHLQATFNRKDIRT